MPEAPTPGMRVLCRDAEWLVTRVDPADHTNQHFAVHCVGADELVRGHESTFLTQLDKIESINPRNSRLVQDPSSGYRLSKLFLEAQLRQMPATGIEPDLESLGAFKPMKYQFDAVNLALKQLRPRLLLADAVGLGKTIQVGMILTELMRRGRANRILVLARKSMLTQFQSELWNRFAIPLVRLDSTGIARLRLRIPASKNPFEVYHRVIMSIDTLKNVGSYQHFLEGTRWDVVVIDEAHNVAGASVPERHLAHRLARLLSRKTDSMLLTTATPHNGKRETFGRLISLLDPSLIPDPNHKEYEAADIKGHVLMRFKEQVRAEAGEDLVDRKLVPLSKTIASATQAEEKAYAILAQLRKAVEEGKNQAGQPAKWKHQALIQYGLYKLFLSSPEACLSTVTKRLQQESEKNPDSPEIPFLRDLEKALSGLSLRASARYQLLKQQLKDIGWDGSPASPRILLFTEYRHTQDALAEALARDFRITYSDKFEDQANQALAIIHGSFPDTHLMNTVEAFGTGSKPVRMLIATDVASEGINLHHECHNIIHYDLPWSIITLIQRNGRIDRFGQHHAPELRYLLVNTEQGLLKGDQKIFERLAEKVEEINRSTTQGASHLKLYDPEAEERYIAEQVILKQDPAKLEKGREDAEASSLEKMLEQASPASNQDLLAFLLGNNESPPPATETAAAPTRLRFLKDKEFLDQAYRYLTEATPDQDFPATQDHNGLFVVTPPEELRRRLGGPGVDNSVVFGATAIPDEAWPEHNQFRLTTDSDRVELAIKAARASSGYWSKELLCTEQHPILQWLNERLLMQLKRAEAPIISSSRLQAGELCFCFIGQLSSAAGTPLVVDAHAISFRRGGGFVQRSLREALDEAGFQSLKNPGGLANIQAAQPLVQSAVEASLAYMKVLGQQHIEKIKPLLRREDRRLKNWLTKREELLEKRMEELGPQHPRWHQAKRQIEEARAYVNDRMHNWQNVHVRPASSPSTQLVLVIEGRR